MAERRMFSKAIIGSGKFLRMPPTARLLYYDLGMAADDDGVVEAYSIMVQTKATEDDLRILVAKGYVQILNEELVALILDWNANNSIRQDRYHPSIYKDLLLQISRNDNQVTTICQPIGNQMETEVRLGKDRLGEVRIGEDRLGEDSQFGDLDAVKRIVDYLNQKTSSHYQTTDSTKRLIRARFREHFTEDDFYIVIDKMQKAWGNDNKMKQYLRPQTLFGTKFESYLNRPDDTADDGEIDWSRI